MQDVCDLLRESTKTEADRLIREDWEVFKPRKIKSLEDKAFTEKEVPCGLISTLVRFFDVRCFI